MSIFINVINQKMIISPCDNDFVAGSQQFVKFKFNFDENWDGLITFAQFKQGAKAYNQYLDEDNCVYLPPEIGAGTCTLMLYGTYGKTIGTTNYLTFKIGENILISDADSTDISESLYNQLVTKIDAVPPLIEAATESIKNADIATNNANAATTAANNAASAANSAAERANRAAESVGESVTEAVETALDGKLDDAAGSVKSSHLSDGCVSWNHIGEGQVTTLALALNSIYARHIVDGNITEEKLSPDVAKKLKFDSAITEDSQSAPTTAAVYKAIQDALYVNTEEVIE